MIRKAGILTLLILCPFSLTGCWDYRELNGLAFVLAMGIDKIPEREEYRFSFQITNVKEIGEKVAGRSLPIIVYSGQGKTLFEAIRKAAQKVPRRINSEHMRILVIGEESAKDGLEEILDFIERDHELRMTTRVLIARGTDAETLLQTLTPLEEIPANAIIGKLQVSGKVWGENYEVEIDDVIRGMLTPGGGPVISGVKIVGDVEKGGKKENLEESILPTQVQISGMALFKGGKLVGWLEGDTARGVSWINDKLESSIVTLDCNKQKDAIAIEILRSRTKIKARFEGEEPIISIHIQGIGNVGEAMCSIDFSKSAELRKLEQLWNEETKEEVVAAVKEVQKLKTDVLGFGGAVERSDPKKWKKIEKEWDEIFADCKVEVKVDSVIRRTGMISKPYLFELNK